MVKRIIATLNVIMPFLQPCPKWIQVLVAAGLIYAFAVIVVILIWFLFFSSPQKQKPNVFDNHGRTQLNSRIKKRADDLYNEIYNEKLKPWIFINTGKPLRVEKHDGTLIQYQGVTFGTTESAVFWGDNFIPPIIENAIVKAFDQTIEECRKNNIDPKPYVYETNSILSGLIGRVYNRMADIDRKLRGKGYPKNVQRKNVSHEISNMDECLKGHYDAAVLLASEKIDTTTPESENGKGGWELVKKISLILGIIVSLIIIIGTYKKYIRKDKIDVSKVSNNFIFHFNAPVEMLFHKNKDIQAEPQSGTIESPQIAPNREEYFKYLPNGLKRNNDGIEITNTSKELKKLFNFMKTNFTKAITGKQFKEMNSLLNQILSEEQHFAYAWFYRGLFFSFASVNPEFKDKFSSIAESSFKKADDLFNILLEKHPNDPFLLLYKGMNLTLLNRAEESVSYLKKSLSLEPDIFQKKHVLGIIACWNHIAPNYLQEWQTAMDEY